MDDEDFKGIVAGLNDAISYAKGDLSRGKPVAGPDVKAIRQRVRLTQGKFAAAFRIPLGTLRDWEQGRRHPDSGSKIYLRIIEADPETVQQIVAKVTSA